MSARGITIINASAGSGKTYRLTKEVTSAVNPQGIDPVPLEGLFAVTYTKKAHAELEARIHHSLIDVGAYSEAMRLPLAYLGTVHAACLRLLQEFALDAGLSPSIDVVAEDQAFLLRQALEAALTDEQREHLDTLAGRFRLRWNAPLRRHDWLRPVGDIMDLARGNRISAAALPEMGSRSADGLLGLFPKPISDVLAATLDKELANELQLAASSLAGKNDQTAVTAKAIELVNESRRRLADDELEWADWAKLAAITASKQCSPLLDRVRELAAGYEAHPRFHLELRALTIAVFDAAQIGLTAYQAWKLKRHVVDYFDMLDGALDLVMHPRVRRELSERLRIIVVDEFQDTSPIQLALFVELHKIATRSVWVGDRKQCIFEYAGADPVLMDAVAAWVTRAGGERDALSTNYRSRPELVNACSELFAQALARHEFTRDEVVVTPHRTTPEKLSELPPFGLWCLETKNKDDDAEGIGAGVHRMLANPSTTSVVDRATGEPRNVRPGDIAILVATNAEARAIAGALHARGIRAAIARAGLLKTPEGALIDAALRWLLDDRDSLAAATIDALSGAFADKPDEWLASKLQTMAHAEASWREPLIAIRDQLSVLSPSEALDGVLAALDVALLCARWPTPAQRVANIDSLRALAAVYEEGCAQDREAATVAGLLRYFDEMTTESLQRDEVKASDDQHVPNDDGAVVVMTYHRAKGLEWPVVVMASLDKAERRDAFEVSPETEEGKPFNPQQPLAGRWIRYWPWPFGGLQKVPLTSRAESSSEGTRIAQREDKERARLLYVGFTRARDHLVLAARVASGKAKTLWLDSLQDAAGKSLVTLPVTAADEATASIVIGTHSVNSRVWRVGPTRAEHAVEEQPRRWFARNQEQTQHAAFRISPSNAKEDWPELPLPTIGKTIALGEPIALAAKVAEYNVLGDAVHAFLAADVPGLTKETRVARATRLLVAASLDKTIEADALLGASDCLRAFVEERWPGAKWHREVPIDVVLPTTRGERRVNGAIDLLLETQDSWVVMDHKTFPGTTETSWRVKSIDFLPQMGTYLAALAQTKKSLACWLHFPVGGGMVEILGRFHAT